MKMNELLRFIFLFSSDRPLTLDQHCVGLESRIKEVQALWDSLAPPLIGYSIFNYVNEHVLVAC